MIIRKNIFEFLVKVQPLFVNTTKLYQFKAKDSEIKEYPLILGNISNDFTTNKIKKKKKKTGLNGYVYEFSVD